MITNKKTTRLLLVEAHTLMRAGVRALLSMEPDLEVIGEAADGGKAIQLSGTLQPELVLIDMCLPRIDGTEAIRRIKRRNRTIKILILTGQSTAHAVKTALVAGADGYVLKGDSYPELLAAIRSVLAGKMYISPSVCGPVIFACMNGETTGEPAFRQHVLTPRERQILKLIAEANKNREIAEYLTISVKTVEKHRANLMKKLNLRSSSALTSYAIECGLVGNTE